MAELTLDEIRNRLSAKKQTLASFGVRELAVFGSTARGESSPDSDLDFLCDLEQKTFDAYMDLRFFLEDLFGCHVDLVLRDALKPALRDTILKEAVRAT